MLKINTEEQRLVRDRGRVGKCVCLGGEAHTRLRVIGQDGPLRPYACAVNFFCPSDQVLRTILQVENNFISLRPNENMYVCLISANFFSLFSFS